MVGNFHKFGKVLSHSTRSIYTNSCMCSNWNSVAFCFILTTCRQVVQVEMVARPIPGVAFLFSFAGVVLRFKFLYGSK